jgi:high-affinity Fe2+/Pb2+ permease
VIIATVSLVLLGFVLDAFLMFGFISMNNDRVADMLSFIIAFLISSLVVGYVFALKIQEDSRIKATAVIDVLSTFTALVFDSVWVCNIYGSEWFTEDFNNVFKPPLSGWTPYAYAAHAAVLVSIVAIIAFVITFIGVYAGSMLRKPSAKTK